MSRRDREVIPEQARPDHAGSAPAAVGKRCLVRVDWPDWDCPILSVAGRIDQAGASVLKRCLHGVFTLGGRYVVVNLSRATHCDELGAVVLQWAGGQARANGGWLRVVGATRFPVLLGSR